MPPNDTTDQASVTTDPAGWRCNPAPMWRRHLPYDEQFVCWHRNGTWREFPDFARAERYAQRTAVLRGPVEITRGDATLAWVRAEADGRVWTEVWPPVCPTPA